MSDTLELDAFADMQGELLRADFNLYAEAALSPIGQKPARHHRLLNAKLQDVADGKISRLMVLMPPGSAKSTYASILFPGWAIAQPSIETIITASATADLAQGFLAKAHRMACSMEPVLQYGFRQARADLWRTTQDREVKAFGAGAATAGRRADVVLIDDPFGSWEDASNQLIRDRIGDWYQGDIIGRLRPGGRVVLVNTHWHQDDLAGRMIDAMKDGGEHWEVILMQAIYDGTVEDPLGRQVGEALWPEWEDVAALEAKRASVREIKWQALFQQNPIPPGGLLFKVEQIKTVDFASHHEGDRVVRYWDIAATEAEAGRKPDWTVGVKLKQSAEGWTVLDVRRFQASSAGVKSAILACAAEDGPQVSIGIPQDPGSAGKMVAQDLVRMLAGFRASAARETGRKVDRASPVASQVEVGNLKILKAPWNDAFKAELAAFPNGKNDDQVDALSGAFNMLAAPPARKTESRNIPWGAR